MTLLQAFLLGMPAGVIPLIIIVMWANSASASKNKVQVDWAARLALAWTAINVAIALGSAFSAAF